MVSVRNIASATGILALSVLAACSQRGTVAPAKSADVAPQVTAQVSAQERKYSFKDGDEVVEAAVSGKSDRGETTVNGKTGEYTVNDLCVGSSDKGCDQVVVIIKKGDVSRQVLLAKNAKGVMADVCVVDGAPEGSPEATVEGAYGTLINKDPNSADCKNSPVAKAKAAVEKAANDVKEAAKDAKEKVQEAVGEKK